MKKTLAVLSTLDTKGDETAFLCAELKRLGAEPLVLDIGVVGTPGFTAGVSRESLAQAGGTPLEKLLEDPDRETAGPVMVAGATAELTERVKRGEVHGVIGLGGTQGTTSCTAVMRALPYGLPKVMVSTIAAGDMTPFVGVKDITMMFSVSDILGLNPFIRRVLASAAGAAYGMSLVEQTPITVPGEKPLVAMTNLGVLTDGARIAIDAFREAGYETIVFHAVGSGGRAMEEMMHSKIVGAVFDYALGEIADEIFHGLRAGGSERLTVAGKLGLPQVLCPGGTEHIGVLCQPHVLPDEWKRNKHVFHSPIIAAPRLTGEQMRTVAREIARRLENTKGDAYFFFPRGGMSRYATPDGPLYDPESDAAFYDELSQHLPKTIEIVESDLHAEDPRFVREAVSRLVSLMER
jgi:uncharacterized protein (UPF0261 family)